MFEQKPPSPKVSKEISVKVCGMREKENIAEVLELPIDFMGFIFYPKSPRFAGDTLGVQSDLSSNRTKKVGVFVNEELSNALSIISKYALDYAQLHGDESPSYCKSIKEAGYPVIKVFSVDGATDFSETAPYEGIADFFLFDTKSPKHGGTGQKFDWNILDRYKGNTSVFLSGGLEPGDVQNIKEIAQKHPWIHGVDLNSRFELAPGLKDSKKLRTFISALQAN